MKITADFENGWQPAVRNLVLASGSVYGRRMVGGIVGRVGETKNGVVIENCANRASVRNTDSKGVGGIVGSAWGSGIIRNCYNTGDIATTYTCPAGGILGTNESMDVYNCYNTGTIDTHGASCGRGIGGHDSGVYTVANCYYLTGCDDDADANGYYQGVSKKISVSCKAMREAEMRQESFVRALNANGAAFAADAAKKNGGYPALWFENGGAESACAVSAGSVQHGTVSVSPSGTVTAGQTAELCAEAEAGWLFDYFTVNGKPIAGAFYTVTEDCTFGAVFKKVRTAKLEFTQGDGFYLAVRRTGWKYDDTGAMVYVTGEPVYSGDTLLEGNVLTLLTHEYRGAQPGDSALEYRSGVVYTVTNAEKNADGSYTVSADGTAGISGVRNTRGKTWASCADKSWYTGKQKSYTITTAEQLAGLAVLVNGGTDFSGVTLKLGADLSLERDSASGAQRSWTPIGTSINRAFRGTFDGQGHKITGLRACNEGSDSALFGCVSGIVGVSYSGEDKIENCANFGAVTGTKSGTYGTGGLAGRLAGTLTKSANYGAVTSADRYTGGLAGYTTARNKTTITLCRNEGAVSSTNTDERAAAGLLVGYAQNLVWGGCAGAADAAAIGRSGSVKQTAVTGEAAAFTAALRPDDVPPPPEKTAQAETESLPLVENGRVTASGSYQIPWFSTGTITVGANLDVALYGGSESFENLTLDVGGGTKLTLQNVVITGDQTLLQLAGGNALTLTGENLLDGTSDTPGSEHPTVMAGGDLTIGGKGSLRVSAQVNNAAVYVSPGSRLRQSGGTLSIRKTDKLGFAGGAFYAPGSTYELTGGTLCGYTDSDNVAVLSAERFTASGGEVRMTALRAPAVLLGSVTLKNCAVTAWGHSGSSAKVSAVYAGEKAIPAIREQSGVRWREALPFADGNALYFTCADGDYTKFAPTYKDITTDKYFFDGENAAEVPAAIALSWTNGALADGTLADLAKNAKDSGSLRFVCGTNEADYKAEKSAGKRMPSGVTAISVATASVSYTDVAAKDWYRNAVTYCSDNGLFKGVGDNKFAPLTQMNMAELATVLYRVAGSTTDNSGEKWYSKQQAWCAEKEIIPADSFKADANVSRAAFITMFYKTLTLDSKYDTTVTDEMRKSVEAAADYASINAADVDAIAWAVSVGLIKGTDDSTLTINPAAEVNRAEVCTMLQRCYTGLAK